MRKSIVLLAALAGMVASPALAQQSALKLGPQWAVSRVAVEDGQSENYSDYLAKVWIPNQEYAKAQGWILDYYVLDNIYPRDGEPNLILITRFADQPSVAEMERRNDIMNKRMNQDDHSAAAASGVRTKMRKLMGSVLYRELGKR